ncbi:MAG: META domain-containing protein [Parafilimonas sp.]|nr:META domain-containing protein [Parafilimonas sp.]
MKKLILVLAFFALNCKSVQAKNNSGNLFLTQNDNDTATLAGHWQLLPVLSSDTSAGKTPQLNFDLKTNRFSGNTGCNAISGSFMIKNDALNFSGNMISTKMACPGYNEKVFIESLLKTNRFEIKNGVLQLMYNTTVLSQWVRHADTNPTKEI